MKKPIAGIYDIDDTCVNFVGHTCSIHYWLKGEDIKESDLTEWRLPDSLNKTFRDYEELIYASQRALPKVIKALDRFRENGYKIILMTARDSEHKRVTEFNLAFNKIRYDGEIYFNKNKSLKINRLSELYDIRMFVDDKLSTVNKVRQETDVPFVYLINTYANRNEEVVDGVIRINNLNDIKEI